MAVLGRRQNRWNPMGLRRDHRGKLLDKYGREMAPDWDEFERKRLKPGDPLKSPKVLNPLHQATHPVRPAAESLAHAVLDGMSPKELLVKARPVTLTQETAREGMLVKVCVEHEGYCHTGQIGRIVDYPYSNDPNWAQVAFVQPTQGQNTFAFHLAELSAAPMAEGISPREFLKKLGKNRSVGPDWPDWNDLEDWQQAAAQELAQEVQAGWEFDEDSRHIETSLDLEAFDRDTVTFSFGRMEWIVYEDEDAAHTAAINRARADLDEPGLFNDSWLESYIDTDHLRHQLWSDVEESARRDFDDQYSDNEEKRDFFLKQGDLDEDECYRTETDDDGDEVQVEIDVDEGDLAQRIDQLSEEHIEAQVNAQLRDPVQYLKDIFGDDDGLKQAMEIGRLNYNQAAADAVSENGVAQWLAPYDNEEISLPSGMLAYRQN